MSTEKAARMEGMMLFITSLVSCKTTLIHNSVGVNAILLDTECITDPTGCKTREIIGESVRTNPMEIPTEKG